MIDDQLTNKMICVSLYVKKKGDITVTLLIAIAHV